MNNVDYKKFTKQEEKIYDESIKLLRKGLSDGLNYKEACASLGVDDQELKNIIVDDFLKICIVEMHYEKTMPLKEVALKLAVSHEDVLNMHKIIIEDVAIASVAEYHKSVSEGQA
jgi:hypothetical protein